jgi:hypothetical protein
MLISPASDARISSTLLGVGDIGADPLRRLAQLKPRTLALMHGASFSGDGAAALEQLADFYAARLSAALAG